VCVAPNSGYSGRREPYAANFDRNSGAPLLRAPFTSDTPEVPSVVVLLAELEAAALRYAEAAPTLPRGPRRRKR
jgi:hypothetical protein